MHRLSIALALSTLLLVSICSAQQTPATAVPNLIRYGGTLKDAQGAALSASPVGVTFAIYKQQDGGAFIWMETQNVTTDGSGNYSVLLGSTTATGLPGDLFSQEEQRWLGVQVEGRAEEPRVLLVSVPYAFKAHEAETLGGLPASAFIKAAGSGAPTAGSVDGTSFNALSNVENSGGNNASLAITKSISPSGTSGFVPIVNSLLANIGDSTIWQDSSTPAHLGIGTTITNPGFKVRIYDPKWPNIQISGGVGANTNTANGILAIATCPACFAVRAKPGDFVVSASSGNTGSLILEANDYNNASIQFATGVTANADTKMTLTQAGNFGVGIVNPTTAFAVGDWTTSHNNNPPAAPFQVDKNGDMVAIKNIGYSWPTGYGSEGSILTDTTGNGALAWGPPPISAICDTPYYLPEWNSSPLAGTLGCSNIQDGPTGISMQDTDISMKAAETLSMDAGLTAILKGGIQTSIRGPGGFVDIGPGGGNY